MFRHGEISFVTGLYILSLKSASCPLHKIFLHICSEKILHSCHHLLASPSTSGAPTDACPGRSSAEVTPEYRLDTESADHIPAQVLERWKLFQQSSVPYRPVISSGRKCPALCCVCWYLADGSDLPLLLQVFSFPATSYCSLFTSGVTQLLVTSAEYRSLKAGKRWRSLWAADSTTRVSGL